MNPKVFVDSDIILDLILGRHPFIVEAKRLFVLIETGKVTACTTPVVFANIFHILRKEYPAETIKTILKNLRQLIAIIAVDESCLDKALSSPLSDFEDALQYHAALASGIGCILTRNISDYRPAAIPVMTAGDFLVQFASE